MPPDYVGILLNAKTYRGIGRGVTGSEALSLYEATAPNYDLIPCYLCLNDINQNTGMSIAYLKDRGKLRRKRIETPEIIHNRAIYKSSSSMRKLEDLQKWGKAIYNFKNRYGKDEIHHLLAKHPWLAQTQPVTLHASMSNIEMMMQRYPDLILKPISSSVGRGIMRLFKDHLGWKLLYKKRSRTRERWNELRLGKRTLLPEWVMHRITQVPYLIQERLPLVEFEGRPLDVRATVQRGMDGKWEITGMYAKVSAPGMFLSNLAQGGSAFPAEAMFRRVFSLSGAEEVYINCCDLALKTAQYLSGKLPLLADLGMDIGVTADGRIYLIECNGRDQRYGFRKAGMNQVWMNTYRKPMAFGRYLLQQR